LIAAGVVVVAVVVGAVVTALPSKDERLAAAAAAVSPRLTQLEVAGAERDATGTFCLGSSDCFVMDAEPAVLVSAVADSMNAAGATMPSKRPLDMGLPTSIEGACASGPADPLAGVCALQGEWDGAAVTVRVRQFIAPDGGARSAAQVDVLDPSDEFVGSSPSADVASGRDAVDLGVAPFIVAEFCSTRGTCVPGGRPFIVRNADVEAVRMRIARDLASRGFAVERASATGLGAEKRLADGRSVLLFVFARDAGTDVDLFIGSPAGSRPGPPDPDAGPPQAKIVTLEELLA
jgi:hypothetical protein